MLHVQGAHGAYALIALIVALAAHRIYLAVEKPLSHIPGPWISQWTNLRLKYAVLTGQRVTYIHKLHQQYGPIVRVSPSEVSLSDIASAKQLYKIGSPFLKSPWYQNFAPPLHGHQNIFTMRDPKEHGPHRRFTSANFSEKWIAKMEPYMARTVHLAVEKMQAEVEVQGYCDTYKWFTFMATDVIGEMSFGESFKMLEIGKKNQYIYDLERVGKRGVLRAELSVLLAILDFLPIGFSNETRDAVQRQFAYSKQSIERYWKLLRADPDNVKPTLLTKEFAAVEDGTMALEQLQRDGAGYIVAGTDTTSLTALYTTWLLANHPEEERRLIEEVAALPADFRDEDLQQLKYLDNVLHESLRLCGPVAQCLPHTVPQEGAEFCGLFVPARCIVGVQQYTIGRDPVIFHDPDRFDPSRWDDATKEMRDCWLPFGGGSRVCLGQHFALLELRHALAQFYRTFRKGMRPAIGEHDFAEDDVTPLYFFLSPPKGKRCFLSPRN